MLRCFVIAMGCTVALLGALAASSDDAAAKAPTSGTPAARAPTSGAPATDPQAEDSQQADDDPGDADAPAQSDDKKSGSSCSKAESGGLTGVVSHLPGGKQVVGTACKAVNGAVNAVGGAAGSAGKAAAGVAGDAAGAAANGVFDQLAKWLSDGAKSVVTQVNKAMQKTTTPELSSGWYQQRYATMAALGFGLAFLVTTLAIGSAALRRDPEALAATVYGVFRAGVATALVVGLTVLALQVADGISKDVVTASVGKDGQHFWDVVQKGWGRSDNFGATAVAALFALVQMLSALAVWIEMLVRSAAIYVAVLFLPVVLAASIWPALRAWESRLTRVLFVFVALKPVVVVVLSLAGAAADAGLTGQADETTGVLLTAIVLYVIAALAPFGLVMLIGEAEGAMAGYGLRQSTAGGMGRAVRAGQQVGGGLGSAASGTGRAAGGLRQRLGSGGAGGSSSSVAQREGAAGLRSVSSTGASSSPRANGNGSAPSGPIAAAGGLDRPRRATAPGQASSTSHVAPGGSNGANGSNGSVDTGRVGAGERSGGAASAPATRGATPSSNDVGPAGGLGGGAAAPSRSPTSSQAAAPGGPTSPERSAGRPTPTRPAQAPLPSKGAGSGGTGGSARGAGDGTAPAPHRSNLGRGRPSKPRQDT